MDTFKKKKLTVISGAPLIQTADGTFLYKPYETEMQIWGKHAEAISFCCPIWKGDRNLLKSSVSFKINEVVPLKDFDITNGLNFIKAFFATIFNCKQILKAMQTADHIHLRCPGNMGLLGSIVQIAFPSIPKSAKYAGNWDPKSKQPWSYRLQKWILSNTFLTRNMQVLVYGEWQYSSTNIKPFFTASYYKSEIVPLASLEQERKIRFVFAGSLVAGKNPQYAIQLINQLKNTVPDVQLDLYGEGVLRKELEDLIIHLKLEAHVFLHGNQNAEVLKQAYQGSHFVILPSNSEGWPKAVAEGMFWGCVPLATPVSCVPNMLDHGSRGILLEMNLEKDTSQITALLQNNDAYQLKRAAAAAWSRTYTLDYFEAEIQQIITS